MAAMSAARSRRYVKSGRTKSIPSCSGVGNISPVSTTTMPPPYSTSVMFLPISPSPPSGRTRRALTSDCAQKPVPIQHRPDGLLLLLRRLHEREPQATDVVPEHVQRSLQRD